MAATESKSDSKSKLTTNTPYLILMDSLMNILKKIDHGTVF